MTRLWENMHQTVRPFVPDCPELAVTEALKATAIDFFEKTHTWLHDCVSIPAEAGRGDYELDVPKETVLARIHQAWYEKVLLTPVGDDQVPSPGMGWPSGYTQREPCTIILIPSPTTVTPTVSMIDAVVALRPSRDAKGLPSELWDRYSDALAYGARARIHETPNQSYTSEEQATKFRRMFYGLVGAARADRNRGLTRAVLVVPPNRFE